MTQDGAPRCPSDVSQRLVTPAAVPGQRDVGVRRLVVLAGGLAVLLLALFLVFEPLLPPVLVDASRWPDEASPATALAAISLLAADVVLPVPSSLVMVASGALFGVVVGTVVSTLGAMSSALIAFGIGRRARGPTRAWLGPAATALDRLMARHGVAAVIATRPIPIVAEITAVLAGSGRLGARGFVVGSIVGSLATSLVYAAIGAGAVQGHGWLAVPVAAVLAAAAWVAGRRVVANDAEVSIGRSSRAGRAGLLVRRSNVVVAHSDGPSSVVISPRSTARSTSRGTDGALLSAPTSRRPWLGRTPYPPCVLHVGVGVIGAPDERGAGRTGGCECGVPNGAGSPASPMVSQSVSAGPHP